MRHLGYTRNMSKREKTDMFKKKGFRSCAIAFLLLNYYFYFLFSVPYVVNQLNSYNMKYGLAAVSMILFLWLIAKILLKLRVTTPLFLIVGLYFVVFYNVFYSFCKYGIHSAAMIGRAAYPFLICVLFFPMHELLRKEAYGKLAVRYLTVFNIIADILLLIQSVLYYRYQLVFMHIPAYEMKGEIGIRDGNIRITFLDTMILFSLFVSMDRIGNRTETRLHRWNVLLSLGAIYFVSQTRSEILICFVCLVICYMKRNHKINLKNILMMICVCLILFLCISYIGKYVIEKFASVSEISITTRFDELEYYLKLFARNPLGGYGMIDPQRNDPETYKTLVHGASMRFSITDIGIVGQTARSGVLILIWYLCYIKYIFHRKYFQIHTCMSVFILLSSVNLVILDTSRIIMIPLIFSLYEIDHTKNTRKIRGRA